MPKRYLKKNSKLDLFLLRYNKKYYEEIITTESCVVDFGKSVKNKFTILTPNSLDFTDKLPTKLHQDIHLSKIVSLKLVS